MVLKEKKNHTCIVEGQNDRIGNEWETNFI